jgi:hypothetical protein
VKQIHQLQKFLLLVACIWLTAIAGQTQTAFTMTAARLQNGPAVEPGKLDWKYSPHDNPRFKDLLKRMNLPE